MGSGSKKRKSSNRGASAIGTSIKNSGVGRQVQAATNKTIVPDHFKGDHGTSYYEIPVIRKQQKDVVYYSGEMSVGELASLTDVANYDSSKDGDEAGYQRNNTEKRGREFGYFISGKENTCIGEIMLNDRECAAEFIPLSNFIPEAPHHKLSAVCGILRIPSDATFFIYDGQTRRFGYISLLHYEAMLKEQGEDNDFQHMKLPFCLEQANYIEEVQRFLQHNGRSAKVPNTHRAMVVFDANAEYEAITGQTTSEKEYSLSAGVIRELNDNRTSPWHRMIKMPDTSVEEQKKLTTTMASFHTGMKGMIRWMNKQYWSPETTLGEKRNDMVEITTTYWRAVKQVCPKIWRNPDNYIMHLAQGVSSMSILMDSLFRDFFNEDKTWNISNLTESLKKSNILTTPKWWEIGDKISKRGGNYKNLELLAQDMYMQIRKNAV